MASLLYRDRNFPEFVFTDKVKSYLLVEFDMVFMDEEFWKIMKRYLESNNLQSITINNLDPEYRYVKEVDVAKLPAEFIKAVQAPTLEGYFGFSATLQMVTIKTLIYPSENEELFCILLDRNYSIGIIGFTAKKPEIFSEYEIKDIADYLKVNFAGKDLPDSLKDELSANWNLLPDES